MQRLDDVQQLAWDSEIACAVLGNAVEYLLIPLDRAGRYPMTEGEVLRARLGDFQFAGVFGIVDGVEHCQIEPGREAWSIMVRARAAYLAHLAEMLRPGCNGVDWLERLHALPDTRDN